MTLTTHHCPGCGAYSGECDLIADTGPVAEAGSPGSGVTADIAGEVLLCKCGREFRWSEANRVNQEVTFLESLVSQEFQRARAEA